MSTKTYVTTELSVQGVFENKYQVERRIEDYRRYIDISKQEILMFAAANPKDIVPEEWKDEVINYIRFEVTRNIEELEENFIELYKLYKILDDFEDSEQD